jgi:hypothetical protein
MITSGRIRWAGRVVRTEDKKSAYKVLVENPEGGTDHLEDQGGSWKDNIKTNLKEIRWEGMDWIHMIQDRAVVNTVMNLRVP